MLSSYLLDHSFMQLISDAIYFYRASVETEDKFEEQRFTRSSILSSTLTIEAAANCCLYQIDGSRHFINDIEKTSSFAKLDLFAQIHNEKFIDRSSEKYQKVAELKKARDSFVHPKRLTMPVKFSIDEKRDKNFTMLGFSFEAKPYPATKIDRSAMFWFSPDARAALESITAFYDYYFLELLELDHKEILGILGNAIFINNKISFTIHSQSLESDLSYLKQSGIKQKFINLEAIPKMNTEVDPIKPPSE